MKKRTIFLFSLLAVFVIGAVVFLKSSLFTIQKIEVRAANPAIKEMVEKELGAFSGKNLWELELGNVSNDLLAKNKLIQTIEFQRRWPNTLFAQVEEREGVALVFIDQTLWSIDREGVAFSPNHSALPIFWPLPTDKKIYLAALAWLSNEKPAEVNGLTWDRELGLILLVDKGNIKNIKIVLGRQNFSENWAKARESIEYLVTRGIQAKKIDATYNKRAVVSL